jgi:uncharacterized protein YndB with AHSA1/START domain
MPSATRAVTIHRSPEAVFAFVADGTSATQWRTGVTDIRLASGSGLGARYEQGVKGPGGRRIGADYEITAWDPPRSLAFAATAGPVRPTGTYTLEAVPEGTRLTFSLDANVGGLKGLFMGKAVQGSMDAEMAALDRLKSVLEATAEAG